VTAGCARQVPRGPATERQGKEGAEREKRKEEGFLALSAWVVVAAVVRCDWLEGSCSYVFDLGSLTGSLWERAVSPRS
jgi:hypothetical protein